MIASSQSLPRKKLRRSHQSFMASCDSPWGFQRHAGQMLGVSILSKRLSEE